MKIRNYSVHTTMQPVPESAWIIDPAGERLVPWVHGLFWWINSKLKIIAPKQMMETVYHFRPIDLGSAREAVMKAVLSYLDRDWDSDDLVVYMGPEQWEGALREMRYTSSFLASEEFRRRGYAGKIVDIPVIVLPEIEGILVVPRPEVLGR